jgi:hypothetical protein
VRRLRSHGHREHSRGPPRRVPDRDPPLWLLIVALITWSLGPCTTPDEVDRIAPGFSYALGFVSALLLFASIMLHPLGQ